MLKTKNARRMLMLELVGKLSSRKGIGVRGCRSGKCWGCMFCGWKEVVIGPEACGASESASVVMMMVVEEILSESFRRRYHR